MNDKFVESVRHQFRQFEQGFFAALASQLDPVRAGRFGDWRAFDAGHAAGRRVAFGDDIPAALKAARKEARADLNRFAREEAR